MDFGLRPHRHDLRDAFHDFFVLGRLLQVILGTALAMTAFAIWAQFHVNRKSMPYTAAMAIFAALVATFRGRAPEASSEQAHSPQF